MVPWRILDGTIREMEPFYQLHQRGGALGRNSLCLDYSTSLLVAVPFKSLYRGHFIPFWSSLISLSVLLLPPLSSEAFFVSLYGQCKANSKVPCNASWAVYPVLARMIQGILAFVIVLLILIIIFNYRRTSGVYNEPLSIAGLGSLLSKSPLLRGLRQIDSMVSNKELKEILQGRRFALTGFVADDQSRCHGIVELDMGSEEGFASVGKAVKNKKGKYNSVQTDEFGIAENEPTPSVIQNTVDWDSRTGFWVDTKQKIIYFGAFLIVGGVFTVITYYHWTGPDPITGKSSGFESFMDSQGFGIRFMMTAVGVGVKLAWANIDTGLSTSVVQGHLSTKLTPIQSSAAQHHTSTFSEAPPHPPLQS
jgi:hypothetical protein